MSKVLSSDEPSNKELDTPLCYLPPAKISNNSIHVDLNGLKKITQLFFFLVFGGTKNENMYKKMKQRKKRK